MQRATIHLLVIIVTLLYSNVNAQLKIDTTLTPEQNYELNCDAFLRYGTYVPQNMDECIIVLLHESRAILDTFKLRTEIDAEKVGFNYENKRLRKSWYLGIHSNLSVYFYKKDVYHPETMESIILVAFHRYLNGKEYNVNDLCTHYKEVNNSLEKQRYKELKNNYKEEGRNRKHNNKIRKTEKKILAKREKQEMKLNKKNLTKINHKKEKHFKNESITNKRAVE